MNVLYEILLDRHVDVSASVRAEVLKGISIIQDESHDFFSRQRANDQSTPLESKFNLHLILSLYFHVLLKS
ncbi:hypothetical protein Tcan_08969 [Toxocara canis]|uniref:Uncharacterized protein n=1 Tax=Toxocara canis TaxID=6265 RepID=A0A0B2W1Z8_TOXCA|nr:hypothetical protein Tcan_08969 [Toxocara canis]